MLQGFTDAYYPMFVDEDNQVLPLNKVIRTGLKDAYGKPYAEIVTPTVVAEARKLFGCPTLTGVPLENEGGNGTASAHWEYRYAAAGPALAYPAWLGCQHVAGLAKQGVATSYRYHQ